MSDKRIFISYSWADNEIVNEIDKTLQLAEIVVHRDIRDVSYRDSIKKFMKSIRRTDFALLVLSDKYLKSKNCMYEILEFVKDENYKERILPIVLDKSIYGSPFDYISYWENELKDHKKKASQLDIKNIGVLSEELKKIYLQSDRKFISKNGFSTIIV